MINENTQVLILGWPDPFNVHHYGYVHRCALKDSLSRMENHLKELNLSERERLYYQFSVLFVDENGKEKLVYTYFGDKKIKVRDEFKDILLNEKVCLQRAESDD